MMEGKEELQSFNVVSIDNNSIIPTTTRRECVMLLIGFILAIVSLQLYEIGISTVTSISSGSSLALEDTSKSSILSDIVPKSKLTIEEYTTNTSEDKEQEETFEVIQLNNNNISLVQISIKRASLSSATVYSVTIQSYDKYTSSANFLGSTTTSLDEHVLLQYEWQPRFPGNYEVLVHKIVQEKWSRNSNTLSTSTLIHPSPFHISIDRLKENSSTEHTSNLLPCQLGDRHVFSKWDGDWIGPSLQQPENPNILRTGWSFIPSTEMNCTIETYSQDDIYDISEKKSIVILGSSIDRGIFLSLVDILLTIEEKVHFEKSVVGKCWGQAIIRKGNLKLMYQDFRTIRFGVPGKDNDNYYECNNEKVAVESPREFVNNATLFWEDLFHKRSSWPSVVYMRTAHFIHAQTLVKKILKAWTGTLYLVDFQLSARQAGLVDQESYETYLKGLKSKLHRLGDDDRIRWLDGIGISKEMRIYSEFTNRVAASQHFHHFCTNDNPQMSVCSNITEMLGQVLLGTAIGPKAILSSASLVPFHIIPRPNLTCMRGPFQEMKLNEIIPYTQRDCPKQCLEQQPNSTFRSQSDVVQQRYCSSDKSETLLLSSSTPIINSNDDDLGLTSSSLADDYIDQDGICVNALPYANMHNKDPKEVERYQAVHIERAGGYAPSYGEREPPKLRILPPGSSFALWNCEKRTDCDSPFNSRNNIKGSAWTSDGKEAFNEQNYADLDRRVIWVQHDRYAFLGTKNTTLKGDIAAMFGFFAENFSHVLHDNFPLLAYLKSVVPEHTTFALPDTKRYRELITFIDPSFTDRIYFYQSNEIITVEEGTLTVANPGGRFLGSYGNTLLRYMRHWIFDNHPETYPNDEKYLIFYSRSGPYTHHGRKLDSQHEKNIIALIKVNMKKYHRNETLIVFTGNDKEGHILPYTEQFRIFRHASTIIGPHGSGLANIVWTNPFPKRCQERVQMLEFIGGTEAKQVQKPIFNGYFWVLRGMPIDWHQITYASNSTEQLTFVHLNDLQQALDNMWGSKETNSSNNITCKWSPGQNDECITHISKLIDPSVQRRWLLFGDSTVFRLFNSSSLSEVLVHSPLGKIHDQQCYRDSQLECHRKKGSRCKLNDLFGFPYRDNWVPHNKSGLNFIGPHKYGASNPYCTDCSGCFSDFLQCALKGNVSSYDSCGFVYGGYIHMEYARDIEIQTPEFLTTQENLAAYISTVWNTRDLIQEWRRPVCVMSAGLHDMTIKNISTKSYVQNVNFMLDKFIPVCDHIIWLGNTSPTASKTSSSNENSTYKQTIPLTKSWDRAVTEMIESETKFTHKISFIDVHESSLTYPHADYIHMTRDWYEKLASGLFLPLIRLSST